MGLYGLNIEQWNNTFSGNGWMKSVRNDRGIKNVDVKDKYFFLSYLDVGIGIAYAAEPIMTKKIIMSSAGRVWRYLNMSLEERF